MLYHSQNYDDENYFQDTVEDRKNGDVDVKETRSLAESLLSVDKGSILLYYIHKEMYPNPFISYKHLYDRFRSC